MEMTEHTLLMIAIISANVAMMLAVVALLFASRAEDAAARWQAAMNSLSGSKCPSSLLADAILTIHENHRAARR
jgi:hypothetical protein